jgi:TetR/AcrR family transcriptional regulator, regulator of autoinduction and epiphytic fitness
VPVKENLSYRQLQAQATRERVAAAARRLFAERGYVGTTVTAIGKAAGIAEPTVYKAFGNKKAILDEIRRVWIRDSEVRPLLAEAMAESDVRRRVDLAARWHRQQLERGYDVIMIYQEAARADPSIAEIWAQVLRGREREKRRFIEALASNLRHGLTAKTATDLYVTLERQEIYAELVFDRGWSPEEYEAWLASTLKQQLFGEVQEAKKARRH